MEQIGKAAKAKESASNYYERHGTLLGWQGELMTLEDIEKGAELDVVEIEGYKVRVK